MMGALKMLATPLRALASFPLVQLAATIAVILLLQAASEASLPGRAFSALDKLVDYTVSSIAQALSIKSFTKSWLTTSFWIGYVYLIGLAILWVLRLLFRLAVDVAGRFNFLWLRNVIARERGIAAYEAWEPFERIRPDHITQAKWEETYAWPADGSPPYRPWPVRLAISVLGYVIVFAAIVALIQLYTPFPVLTWLRQLVRMVTG